MTSKNRRLFELKLGKLGVVLFICGMSLLLFSMFLFGVVVGKNMEAYPEKYSAGLAELIREHLLAFGPKAGKGAQVQVEQGSRNEAAGGEDRFDLTFYDTLTGKKGGAAGDPPAGSAKDPSGGVVPKATGPAGENPPGGMASAPPPAVAEESRKENMEKTGTAAKKAEKPEIPPAQPKPEETVQGKGRYEVQAAAYRERSSAEKLVQRLSTLGFSSRVVAKELPGSGQWFRVIIGGYENRAKAQEAAEKLAAKVGGLKCVIRPARNGGN